MASTYEKIATTTLGSAAADVTFSSISGAYTDLVLICSILGTSGVTSNVVTRVNGDTGSNYSSTYLYGTGSTAASGRQTNSTHIFIAQLNGYAVTNQPMPIIVNFQNYSNTNTYKTILSRGNSAGTDVMTDVGLWRSTSAINSITVKFDVGNLQSGSTATLYGILKA